MRAIVVPPACVAEGLARRRLVWFVQTESGVLLIRIATQRHAQPIARSIERPGGGKRGIEWAGAAHDA